MRARRTGLSSRPIAAVVSVALVAALALVPTGIAAADDPVSLGPVPVDCGVLGLDYADPSCLTQTRLGTFSLDPHHVHAGGVLTGTVALNGNFPIDWPSGPGEQVAPCSRTTTTCSWRIPADAATQPYTIMTVGITNEQGLGISKDYYAIIGRGQFLLGGHIKDADGNPVPGVRVRIVGPTTVRVDTNAEGMYTAVLPRGRYVVTPYLGSTVFGPQPTADCTPAGESCRVNLIQDRTADFTSDTGQKLSLAFSPSSTPANGFTASTMTLADRNIGGYPIPNQAIDFSPPLADARPRALICSSEGRLYPTAYESIGEVQGGNFTRTTDARGEIVLTVVTGTQPSGPWSVQANVPGSTEEGETVYSSLDMTGAGGGGTFGPAIVEELRRLRSAETGTSGSGGLGSVLGVSTTVAQEMAMDWLLHVKREHNALPGVDVAPIHSTEPIGHEGVGILFYPHGTAPDRILFQGTDGYVWDIGEQARLGNLPLPQVLPNLIEWESGGEYPHGRAIAGFATPVAGSLLSYFGLPYPPPMGSTDSDGLMGRLRFEQQCAPVSHDFTTVTVHSPVAVSLRDAAGRRVGIAASGALQQEAAGIVSGGRNEPTTIVVPNGSYRMTIAGTGSGGADIVVWPQEGSPQVMSFDSRKGAQGSARISAAGSVSKASFAGSKLAVTTGLAMSATGLPKTLKPGTRTLRIKVRDQFGDRVSGAVVTAGRAARGSAVTDAGGVASLVASVRAKPRARIVVRVTSPGLRPVTLRASVAR